MKLREGCEIYAFDDRIIPAKYGRVPLEYWKTKWLLEEKNISLKELLIEQIPEEKIRLEFQTTEELNQAGILTAEQEKIISKYDSQWQSIAFSIEKNNEILVKEHINQSYQYLNLEIPQILFFDSPYAMQNYAIKHEGQNITDLFEENIFTSAQKVISYRE